MCVGCLISASAPCSITEIRAYCHSHRSGTSVIINVRTWRSCSLRRRTNLKDKQVMDTARDLNFGSDEMQVVITALHDVGRRIREVAETHKPLFGGEHFLTGKEVCERLYISPRTLQDYRDKGIIPYTQFAGKILYKASDLERLLEENYSA